MPKTNPLGIHEWNGDSTQLPPADELYMYMQNVYYWHPCDCGNPYCTRPLAFHEDGKTARGMTIRVRGTDTGKPEIDLLYKIGANTDEVVEAIENGGDEALLELFKYYLEQDPFGKGLITREEFNTYIQALIMEAFGLGDMLRRANLIQNSFGGLRPSSNGPWSFGNN